MAEDVVQQRAREALQCAAPAPADDAGGRAAAKSTLWMDLIGDSGGDSRGAEAHAAGVDALWSSVPKRAFAVVVDSEASKRARVESSDRAEQDLDATMMRSLNSGAALAARVADAGVHERHVLQNMKVEDAQRGLEAATQRVETARGELDAAQAALHSVRSELGAAGTHQYQLAPPAKKRLEAAEAKLAKVEARYEAARRAAAEARDVLEQTRDEVRDEMRQERQNTTVNGTAALAAPAQKQGETKRDFLIRTGMLTPFDASALGEDDTQPAMGSDNVRELSPRGSHVTVGAGLNMPRESWDALFEYQRTGVRWLWELHEQRCGGIIGDEMGLGKTVQVASFLGALHFSGLLEERHGRVLVVAPVTMIDTWVREINKWAPGLRVCVLHASLHRTGKANHQDSGDDSEEADSLSSSASDEEAGTDATVSNESEDSEDSTYRPNHGKARRSGGGKKNGYRKRGDARRSRKTSWVREKQKQTRTTGKAQRERSGLQYEWAESDLVITSYEGLRRRAVAVMRQTWSYVILDEGHKIRNPDAEITQVCKRFATPHRIILSGSPLQNRLRELWSLFDFIFPGKLGTLPVFEKQFSVPIALGTYTTASPTQTHIAYHCAKTLKKIIDPYLLRRVKADVALHLPKKSEHIVFCRLTAQQRKLYDVFVHSKLVQSVLNRDEANKSLAAIIELRKICNHPKLASLANMLLQGAEKSGTLDGPDGSEDDSEIEESAQGFGSDIFGRAFVDEGEQDDDIDPNFKLQFGRIEDEWRVSGKMIVLDKILQSWSENGHKVLLFSQSRMMLDVLQDFLGMRRYTFRRMDGTTPVNHRMSIIDQFNSEDSSIFVLLMTTKVGGLGINLTGADRVLIFDPDWNPSTDLQARERAWRIGQKRPVTILRLVTSGTIEEKMYHRQIYKQFISAKVLSDPKQRRLFRHKQMRDLFALGTDEEAGTETGDLFRGAAKEIVGLEARAGRNGFPDSAPKSGEEDIVTDAHSILSPSDGADGEPGGKQEAEAGKGDGDLLRSLFERGDSPRGRRKGGGVHSTINHDDVLGFATKHEGRDLALMEHEASKFASEALRALEASREQIEATSNRLANPTFTGLSGFDPAAVSRSHNGPRKLPRGSAASSHGSGRALVGMLKRQSTGASGFTSTGMQQTVRTDTEMVRALVRFFHKMRFTASTTDILSAMRSGVLFSDEVMQNEPPTMPVLKAVLKRIATIQKTSAIGAGTWELLKEFRTDAWARKAGV